MPTYHKINSTEFLFINSNNDLLISDNSDAPPTPVNEPGQTIRLKDMSFPNQISLGDVSFADGINLGDVQA